MTTFTAQEYLRYTRHIQLPQVGARGQTRLKHAHVLIVGCGGLGAPVSLYLAAAGIGHITVVDGDCVELSNLQRQVAFVEADIGSNKAHCTRQRLVDLNSDINAHAVEQHLDADNARELISGADIVLDCSDNFDTRCIVNQTCRALRKPWVYASVHQFSGQCAVFTPQGPCFRCLFEHKPDNAMSCSTAGVLGVLPGLLGTLQANEALKYLLELEGSLANQLLMVEALDLRLQTIALTSNPACICCGSGQSDSNMFAAEDEAQAEPNALSAQDIQALVENEAMQFIDVRSPQEYAAFNLGGRNVPLAQIEDGEHGLAKSKPVVLYCQAGPRSERARALLAEQGYEVCCLSGGLAGALKQMHKQEPGFGNDGGN